MKAAGTFVRAALPWLGLVALALLVLLTYRHYGITWDESFHFEYGRKVLAFFQSGFRDRSCNAFADARFYGPLVDFICVGITQLTPGSTFEIKHLVLAVFGVLTIVGVFRLGGLLGDPLIPWFAALALLAMPPFYGHMFNNPKDVPFACFFTWAIYAMLAFFRRERFAWRDAVGVGVAIGLALAVRAGGLLLFYYLAMAAGFYVACETGIRTWPDLRRAVSVRTIGLALAMAGAAWAVMVSVWPWALENPVLNPVRAFLMSRNFDAVYPVLYRGEVLMSDTLPWHYLPNYLLIGLPPAILALAAVGFGACIARQAGGVPAPGRFMLYVLELWILFPVLYFVAKQPNVYDGMRHFLFLLPCVAVFAGIGAAFLVNRLAPVARRGLAAAAAVLLLLSAVPEMVYLHPYEATYFNVFAGGLEKAGRRYETDYWVSSYKEAVAWVNARARESRRPLTVLVAANAYSAACAAYYAGPGVDLWYVFGPDARPGLPDSVDYYIATTRYSLSENYPAAPVVHVVGRHGVPFTVIKGRRDGPGAHP